jgi:2-oxoglutarate ferredoxin oxidoreductase subunit gamma
VSDKRDRHEVLIAGFGGQGVVLAGKLLATAALAEGREVVWAPSYGPEMRGGPVDCTVIVSTERIGSPEVSLADSLLIMDRASLDRFSTRVKPGGLLIVNSTLVPAPEAADDCTVLLIPATEAASELGEPRAANVVMLGALLHEREVVSPAGLVDAMRETAGKAMAHLLDANCRALERGMELAAGVSVPDKR